MLNYQISYLFLNRLINWKRFILTIKKHNSNTYCQTCNIRHTLVGNKIVDHSALLQLFKFGDLVWFILGIWWYTKLLVI